MYLISFTLLVISLVIFPVFIITINFVFSLFILDSVWLDFFIKFSNLTGPVVCFVDFLYLCQICILVISLILPLLSFSLYV